MTAPCEEEFTQPCGKVT
jgi:hypothetical protein